MDRLFSIYIRTRDTWVHNDEVRIGCCVTCGARKPFKELDCGHYIGRQWWATRWDTMNCAAQCRFCNRFNEGMKGKFRLTLVQEYGESAIQQMEQSSRSGRKPRLYEIELIAERIKADTAKLKDRSEIS